MNKAILGVRKKAKAVECRSYLKVRFIYISATAKPAVVDYKLWSADCRHYLSSIVSPAGGCFLVVLCKTFPAQLCMLVPISNTHIIPFPKVFHSTVQILIQRYCCF